MLFSYQKVRATVPVGMIVVWERLPVCPAVSNPPNQAQAVPVRGSAPALEPQVAHGLAAHQGHHPERPALELDLSHHAVHLHVGDQPDEPVAR